MEGTLTGTHSTRPSSNIIEIFTTEWDAESSEDGLMPPSACHCSCESLTALRRSTVRFTQAQSSATTCEQDAVSTWLQSSKTSLLVMLSQIAESSANRAIPDSKKKFLWVKCGLLKKSCTQNIAPGTSSSAINAHSRLMMNFSTEVTGPRTMRAVSWSTWKKQNNSLTTLTMKRLYLIVHDTYFEQNQATTKTACKVQNDRTSPTSRRLLVEDSSSCRCFWTKTGTQPDTPQSRCLSSTPFPKAHPTKDQVDEVARGCPRQW